MAVAAAVSLRRPLTCSHAVSTGAKRVWNGGDVPPVRATCWEWEFWSDPAGRSLVALGQDRGPRQTSASGEYRTDIAAQPDQDGSESSARDGRLGCGALIGGQLEGHHNGRAGDLVEQWTATPVSREAR